jgi:hypothetical protein
MSRLVRKIYDTAENLRGIRYLRPVYDHTSGDTITQVQLLSHTTDLRKHRESQRGINLDKDEIYMDTTPDHSRPKERYST